MKHSNGIVGFLSNNLFLEEKSGSPLFQKKLSQILMLTSGKFQKITARKAVLKFRRMMKSWLIVKSRSVPAENER